MRSKDIFADKMGYKKVRQLIFWKFTTNIIIKRFNAQENRFAIICGCHVHRY